VCLDLTLGEIRTNGAFGAGAPLPQVGWGAGVCIRPEGGAPTEVGCGGANFGAGRPSLSALFISGVGFFGLGIDTW